MPITTIVPVLPIVNIDVSAASKVIMLPAARTCQGTTFYFKDYKGAASTNNIFVSTNGLDRVNGQSLSSIQLRLTSTMESLKVMSLGNTSWSIIQRNKIFPSILTYTFYPNLIAGLIIQTDASALPSPDGTVLSTWTNYESGGTVNCTGTVNTNILNGLRVVTLSTSATWAPATNVSLSSYSMFFVGRQTGGTNRRIIQDSTSNQLYGYWNGKKQVFYINDNPSYLVGVSSDTSWDMFSVTRVSGGAYIFNWNGSLLYSSSSSASNILTNPVINQGNVAGRETSDCQVAEILIYNSVLTPAQVATVEGYLKQKWGLS